MSTSLPLIDEEVPDKDLERPGNIASATFADLFPSAVPSLSLLEDDDDRLW